MSLINVEAIRGRCASFMIITATVSEIFGGHTQLSLSSDCHQYIHIVYKFVCRLDKSKKTIVKALLSSSIVYSFPLEGAAL